MIYFCLHLLPFFKEIYFVVFDYNVASSNIYAVVSEQNQLALVTVVLL